MNTELGEATIRSGDSRTRRAGTKREFLIDGRTKRTGPVRHPAVHYKLCLLAEPVVPRAVKRSTGEH